MNRKLSAVGSSLVLRQRAAAADMADAVVVTPKEIDEVLVNPSMGFTIKKPGGEKEVPNYPECSIVRFSLSWADLEKVELAGRPPISRPVKSPP